MTNPSDTGERPATCPTCRKVKDINGCAWHDAPREEPTLGEHIMGMRARPVPTPSGEPCKQTGHTHINGVCICGHRIPEWRPIPNLTALRGGESGAPTPEGPMSARSVLYLEIGKYGAEVATSGQLAPSDNLIAAVEALASRPVAPPREEVSTAIAEVVRATQADWDACEHDKETTRFELDCAQFALLALFDRAASPSPEGK